MYLKNRINRLERDSSQGGRNLVVLAGNRLTDWGALEQRYFREYGRTPEHNDLVVRLLRFSEPEQPDPGRILSVGETS